MQIFGVDQDDSLVVMGFLFKNKDAVLLLRQQALRLNIVPKYERYAKNGNPFAMEFVKTFKDSDQVYSNNQTWNLWEDFGIYHYYMMFTWQGFLAYLYQSIIVMFTICTGTYWVVLITYYNATVRQDWEW